MKLNAIILAGRSTKPSDFDPFYTGGKAFIKIGNRLLLQNCLEELRLCEYIDKIILIAPKDEPRLKDIKILVDDIVPSGESTVLSALNGINALPDSEFILQGTADLPFLKSSSLKGFIDQCTKDLHDFHVPVISKVEYDQFYPQFARTYGKLKEGQLTGGNFFIYRREAFLKNVERVQQLIKNRKSPFKLASMLGIGLLVRFITGTLDLPYAEKRFGKIFNNISVKAERIPFADLFVDIDKAHEIPLVKAAWEQQS